MRRGWRPWSPSRWNPATWGPSATWRGAFPPVFCTQGIHPHQADQWDGDAEGEILSALENPSDGKIVAVGEIGLDFHYNRSPPETQMRVFRRQLEIAAESGLPVVIHSREADERMVEALRPIAGSLSGGVIHSFSSGLPLAEWALDNGLHLGFNGIATFKKAEEVREAVRICPLDRILLETDSPYLAPVPHRGKENTPAFLPLVAEKVAEVKGTDVREVQERTSANARALFRFDERVPGGPPSASPSP